jgi:D-tyrosyl-tRNA(Tyr) deacylase
MNGLSQLLQMLIATVSISNSWIWNVQVLRFKRVKAIFKISPCFFMRMVIQRVKEASVRVDGTIVGQIKKGALVLFGVHKTDIPAYTPWMAQKLMGLRYFSDAQGKMNLSLQDIQGEVLIVSQFTLYANCNEGRRPGFDAAAPGAVAKMMYEKFVDEVKQELKTVQTGIFGADMEVSLVNDGPVTFVVDYPT